MAKETMIVFVYDTECLKTEADDPVNAVLYFHPSWVSDAQKFALCGQLMGSSYFLKQCFFKPRILALQNGKFVLKEFGRFILAVGTDRNISDFLLQQRADLLASLVRFYHRDLQTIFEQFPLQSQYKNLSDKLYHIFETYLPILQYNGNIFQNVPTLRIPKTGSNIFLDAIQTLQCCQQTKGILGGAILYHNKVVATQLNAAITKQLVITDPLHIRPTAEQTTATDFHIPNGVQMLIVYIELPQYRQLVAAAQRAQQLQTTQLAQGPLSFPFAKRKMKRDKSLIFSHIPEESSMQALIEEDALVTTPAMRPKTLQCRPTHLPLRSKNMLSKELPESGFASINFDETDSYPEFIGRTSVCSTPMTENKVLPVSNIMSICANADDATADVNNLNKQQRQKLTQRRNSFKLELEKFFHSFMSNDKQQLQRRSSLGDLQQSFRKFSKKLTLRKQLSHENNKTDANRNGWLSNDVELVDDEEPMDFIDIAQEQLEEEEYVSTVTEVETATETDAKQHALFQQFLQKYYTLWDDSEHDKQRAEIDELMKQFKQFDEQLLQLETGCCVQQQADDNFNMSPAATIEEKADLQKKQLLNKKALSLPIKPLCADSTDGKPVMMRKQTVGIPLTPLMAKLSVLALHEEQQHWDATTAAGIEIQTPMNANKLFSRCNSLKFEEAQDAMNSLAAANTSAAAAAVDGLQKVELYICGQQNMTLLLLMEEGASQQQQLVQKMFDICVSKFPHMETHLNQTLNVHIEGDKHEGAYSFMYLDAKWDALQRNGAWNPLELNTLEAMHRDLQQPNAVTMASVTDLILRTNDSVYYGAKLGRSEFFYKEPVHQLAGIPPPSDPMANVAMRAKTRLEREHSYVLF